MGTEATQAAREPAGALVGVRVLDLTQVLAGPYCAQILGDLGADVIKIESPEGDQARESMGPKLAGNDRAGFLAVNRNKRSVALNLRKLGGAQAFERLARTADVVVENFRPGVTRRLGVDYETVRAWNPRIVYASISGFGQTGPEADRPGYDLIAQAMAGIMSVTGDPDGAPAKCGIPICDLTAGLYATIGILAGLAARRRTGEGQHVETSLYDAAVGLSIWEAVEYWATGNVPQRLGSAHRFNAPYQALATKDGYLTVAANNPKSWSQLCRTLERDDLFGDPRFVDNDARMQHRDALVNELEKTLMQATTEDWEARLTEVGVACGPIRSYPEVLADPHTRARDLVVEVPHPVEGATRALATPVHLDQTPATVRTGAPLLGADTTEVLNELGYHDDQIAQLVAEGAISLASRESNGKGETNE